MSIIPIIATIACFTAPLTVDVQTIGEKIWNNECGGVRENLTHWGKGEEFASFGIGHFIWYSQEKKGPFKETFPQLLHFLEERGEILPEWLKNNPPCPWSSREEFYEQFKSPQMTYLRNFLFKTRNLQALFMAERLKKKFPKMMTHVSPLEKRKAMREFNRLSKTPKGLYALIDYLNFKGAGTSFSESYQGHRWGLLQVLLAMPSTGDEVVAFTETAKKILTERVAFSPPERNEKKWLPGWINRLNTYVEK